jgi:uncharacterized protein involved in exopolysaccharide biosynthesis
MKNDENKKSDAVQDAGRNSNDEAFAQLLKALADPEDAKKKQGIDIGYYLEVASRRRWLFLIPFVCILAAGTFVLHKMPKIYEASTLILVQPQRVPSDYVRPVVTDDIEDRIGTISQQINSRSNLEKIIDSFSLFSGAESADMLIEDKLANIRNRIKVDLSRKSRRDDPDAFTVSFQGKDPQKVMGIANALAQNFIDENLRIREAQVLGTDTFLENQLQSMRGSGSSNSKPSFRITAPSTWGGSPSSSTPISGRSNGSKSGSTIETKRSAKPKTA